MRITVIEHEADAGPGFLDGWLDVACEVVRPYRGEPVPDRAADGLIVLGGEPAAWEDDTYPWLPATRDLLARAVSDGTPTLGVCLGAQLMTMACGGTVERGGEGLEVGLCEVTALPEAASDRLLSGVGAAVAIQYHRDVMSRLPDGAVPLMTGPLYPHQAYRLGSTAWAVQFHPEATPDIFATWATGSALASGEEHIARVRAAEDKLVAAWRPVAEAFAAVVRASTSA
ncbi:type 1 glutamine amidotransferase [Nonomuraea muscovyensis]|uniref:GMP synthase-like glutamine amidotransferase n=1 Tax=Nonomuraea muscovyensis TaxID=1124761 RepID=A0A7X0ETZ4_9ACTN|nr:type 1 glutamine amidotransferase [Nonomuraea muscovyensis]MBB6344207.1 GMP synthase-like glutamine amidotransferase [Nonomuraea muscovyensis]MDF2712654.1 synthase [Nonomuraea muscovyensis]